MTYHDAPDVVKTTPYARAVDPNRNKASVSCNLIILSMRNPPTIALFVAFPDNTARRSDKLVSEDKIHSYEQDEFRVSVRAYRVGIVLFNVSLLS